MINGDWCDVLKGLTYLLHIKCEDIINFCHNLAIVMVQESSIR